MRLKSVIIVHFCSYVQSVHDRYVYVNDICFNSYDSCFALPEHHLDYYHQSNLLTWLRENGAIIEGVEIVTFPQGYRGIQSTASFKAGEITVSVPFNLTITTTLALERPLSQSARRISSELQQDMDSLYLVLYLLEFASSETSFFKPYFDLLPPTLESYAFFPDQWSDEEATALLKETSYALKKRNEIKQKLASDFNSLKQISEFQQFSFENFLWAQLVVRSRYFELEDGSGAALVPFIDMMNHHLEGRGLNTDWFFNDTLQAAIVVAEQDIQVGEEVLYLYEDACNTHMLLHYGFTIDPQLDMAMDYNYVQLKYPMPAKDPKFGRSAEPQRIFQLFSRITTHESTALLSYLRYIFGPEPKIQDDPNHDFMAIYVYPISIENELKVLTEIETLCQEQLDKYTSTLDQDVEIRLTTEIGRKKRNALNILISEKEILRYYMYFTYIMKRWLQVDDKTFAREYELRYGKNSINKSSESYYTDAVVKSLRQVEVVENVGRATN